MYHPRLGTETSPAGVRREEDQGDERNRTARRERHLKRDTTMLSGPPNKNGE
jgi:hypothetical protein